MNDICPNAEKCPIFTGILKDKSFTTKAYKEQYCEAGIEAIKKCKRYQCKQRFGKVPENLLPNSGMSLDEIQKENNW
ncbi:MAG TPA: hypothetical protein PK520_00930 [Exilispira sp.]|nr:hypothetical protein [Spirochaetota bacterium]HQJ40791.1 hypothetical protein [Exilispira sp.]HQM89128.1 hypothetical protein [Exilispira sp.]HQQ18634.1 hypothetical protein [Exilispira sp.]